MRVCLNVIWKELVSQNGNELYVSLCLEGEWQAGAGVEGLYMTQQKSTSTVEQRDSAENEKKKYH